MTYTANSLCYATLPALLSKTNITSSELSGYINKAEAIVNGKLAMRYTVPITDPCPLLETLATDLSVYFSLRRTFSQEKKNESEWPRTYKDSLQMITDIGAGKMILTNSAGAIIAQRTDIIDVWSNNMDYEATFTEDDMINQVDDSDKIDDIRDARSDDLSFN